jgi:hypothetical protein
MGKMKEIFGLADAWAIGRSGAARADERGSDQNPRK